MKTKILLLSFLLLAGCNGDPSGNDYDDSPKPSRIVITQILGYTKNESAIERFHDDEMSATCWIVGSRANCIPDTMLVKHRGIAP